MRNQPVPSRTDATSPAEEEPRLLLTPKQTAKALAISERTLTPPYPN